MGNPGNKIYPVPDYQLAVLRGQIPGHSRISIRGHDDTVPNGGPFGLSQGFGGGNYQFDQSAIAATPAAIGVASSSTDDDGGGTGALTARLSGLDTNGVAQTEDITFNGQTEDTTSAEFSAVDGLRVLTTGSGNENAGTLWVGTGSFTSGIPAVRMLSVKPGHNQSLSGYFVVPTGKTLYLQQLIATLSSGNKDAEFEIRTSLNGILWVVQGEFAVTNIAWQTPIIAIPGLAAGVHVSLVASGGAASTPLTAILAGELVDD